jgi:glycosyltransferase involved in cell wall biosynthesis
MISVVMSIYKTEERYICKAIDSILSQTFSDFEFIIINNGNASNINDLVESYSDKRINLIHTPKVVTLYESREIGVQMSRYQWIALMDADDVSHRSRLERQYSYIESHKNLEKLGCVGTWAQYMNEKDNVIGHRKSRPTSIEEYEIMRKNNDAIIVTDPSSIISKKAFLDVGGYRKEYSPAADLDLWYKMVEKGYIILSIESYLFKYRIHSEADSTKNFMLQRKKTHFCNLNMENRRSGKSEITYDQFCEIYWSNVNYRFPRMWRNYSKLYYKKAGLLYLNGSIAKAVAFLSISFIINPIYVLKRLNSHLYGKGSL